MPSDLSLPARFTAFAFVGGLCLGLHTLALWGLTSVLGLHYLLSTILAFAAITPIGFLLNKALTFRTAYRHTKAELPRYVGAMTASFLANLAAMYLLVSVLGVWYLLASLLVAVTLLLLNFLASDRWSFRAHSP
jgi:putative flippase GtrA